MDKEYIDREAAVKAVYQYLLEQTVSKYATSELCIEARGAISRAMDVLDDVPAADVAPVVHGEWVYETDEDAIWRTKAICSACKYVVANNTHLTHESGVENFEKLHKFFVENR